jgi:uncharacterized lipoprotein NlpE involved in copper resistance
MNTKQRLMTKIWIAVAIFGIVFGCGGNASKTNNSLNCEGTYTGKIPTASGMGMIVTITLEKDTYHKKIEYVDKEGIFENKGTYTLNKEEKTLILNGISDSPNKYAVEENRLIQLDMEGKRITGELANQYILQKEQK